MWTGTENRGGGSTPRARCDPCVANDNNFSTQGLQLPCHDARGRGWAMIARRGLMIMTGDAVFAKREVDRIHRPEKKIEEKEKSLFRVAKPDTDSQPSQTDKRGADCHFLRPECQ